MLALNESLALLIGVGYPSAFRRTPTIRVTFMPIVKSSAGRVSQSSSIRGILFKCLVKKRKAMAIMQMTESAALAAIIDNGDGVLIVMLKSRALET